MQIQKYQNIYIQYVILILLLQALVTGMRSLHVPCLSWRWCWMAGSAGQIGPSSSVLLAVVDHLWRRNGPILCIWWICALDQVTSKSFPMAGVNTSPWRVKINTGVSNSLHFQKSRKPLEIRTWTEKEMQFECNCSPEFRFFRQSFGMSPEVRWSEALG